MRFLADDLRFAFRGLLRSPGFLITGALILALGIGANTAIFSLVNAAVLHPLPYANPGRLVEISANFGSPQDFGISLPDIREIARQNHSFESVGFYQRDRGATFAGDGAADQVKGVFVSPGLLDALGVNPQKGRKFLPEETLPGKDAVVIVSNSFWKQYLGHDNAAVGKTIRLENQPYTIIGIMPPGFFFPNEFCDIWRPAKVLADAESRSSADNFVIARLESDLKLAQARADLDTIAARLSKTYPEDEGLRLRVTSLREKTAGPVQSALLLLLAAVGCVLLIACANISGLLLVRNAGRRKEFAIRTALGAGRSRLIRQMLLESLLLGLIGGLVGLTVALVGLEAVRAVAPPSVPHLSGATMNGWVVGFACLISLLAGVLVGSLPAFRSSGLDPAAFLKEGELVSQTGFGLFRSHRLQSALVVSQISIALVLMMAAGLVVESFSKLMHVQLGFDPDNLLTLRLSETSLMSLGQKRADLFYQNILAQIRALPGVQSAALVSSLPLGGLGVSTYIAVEGGRHLASGRKSEAQLQEVSAGYFDAMRIPILQGRAFTDDDTDASQCVAIVNQAAERAFWSGQSPLGRKIDVGYSGEWCQVVGVAGDSRDINLENEPQPEIYRPLSQEHELLSGLLVRSSVNPASLGNAVVSRIWSVSREERILGVMTMHDVIARSAIAPRFHAALFFLFAGLALVLAVVGLYGVMAHSVGQRSREFGIRIALGAQRGDILRIVAGQAVVLSAAGLTLGMIVAFATRKMISSLLFGIGSSDRSTSTASIIILIFAVSLASYMPARRAMRVDPGEVLRHE